MSILVLALFVITLLPVVPYSFSIADPAFPYRLQGYMACQDQFMKNNSVNFSDPAFQHCIAQFRIPPINVTGYGSLSFVAIGVGVQPFPALMSVGESDFYALLQISGTKNVAAQLVPQQDVVYDAPGITISNATVSQAFLGSSNITVTVTNQTGQTLNNLIIFVSAPGSSGNHTDRNGVTWMFRYGYADTESPGFGRCLQYGKPQNLTSGSSCTVNVPTDILTTFGSPFRYSVEVQGLLGSQYSVTKRSFSYSISNQTVNRLWTAAFIKLVNEARGNSSLLESATLDKFANLRFDTAVTVSDISDYGLYADESSFFAANSTRPDLVEIMLYPAIPIEGPFSYADLIQQAAPGHWSALTDSNYTHFGWFVGTGPYEVVHQPCPISEIPRAGINITQYFESAGCQVSKQESTWFVVILGS